MNSTFTLRRDGAELSIHKTYADALHALHRVQGQSAEWAMKHEGYSITEEKHWLDELNEKGFYVVFRSELIGEEIGINVEENLSYSVCRCSFFTGEKEWHEQVFTTPYEAMGCAQLMAHFAERLHDFVKYGEEVITD